MKVYIQLDGLIFAELTDDQKTEVLKHSEGLRIKEVQKGLKVLGKGDALYKLMYKVSYNYDIELI
jgi:hypothetical protein